MIGQRRCLKCKENVTLFGSNYCRPCWDALRLEIAERTRPQGVSAPSNFDRVVALAIVAGAFLLLWITFARAAEPRCECWWNGTLKQSSKQGYVQCQALCRSIAL